MEDGVSNNGAALDFPPHVYTETVLFRYCGLRWPKRNVEDVSIAVVVDLNRHFFFRWYTSFPRTFLPKCCAVATTPVVVAKSTATK